MCDVMVINYYIVVIVVIVVIVIVIVVVVVIVIVIVVVVLIRSIPSYKQRIAGKSIPVEKFVIAKSERALEGSRLPICGLVRGELGGKRDWAGSVCYYGWSCER